MRSLIQEQHSAPRAAFRVPTVAALVEEGTFERVVGPVREVRIEPGRDIGFSGARLELVSVRLQDETMMSFALKTLIPAHDVTCVLTGATHSREAALLAAPELADVWSIFRSPYIAYAESDGAAGLLMHDLTDHLFPDERKPIAEADEFALLDHLARLHARFWQQKALAATWLAPLAAHFSMLGADCFFGGVTSAEQPDKLRESVVIGWQRVMRRVSGRVADLLRVPGTELQQHFSALPRTLVHGDAKIANFAVLPDGSVSAFDWALAGRSPVSVDLGWYLAVNATRLATPSKEETIRRYRTLLEAALQERLPEVLWQQLEQLAVLVGARMLLWAKANALETGSDQATREWQWWTDRLTAIV